MRIKLRQIEHALAVWRQGSFRGASDDQHLSQPALSRSVQALEDALGVALFDRMGNEVTLTRFGEAFIRRAERLVIEAGDLEREMRLMKGLGAGRFSVAMGAYPADISGRRALAELARQHPQLKLRSTIPHPIQVSRLVHARQVDLGFAEVSDLQGQQDFTVEPVGQHEAAFYCRPGHPLLESHAPLCRRVLDEYPFAGVTVPARLAPMFPRNVSVDDATGDLFPPIMVDDLVSAFTVVAATDAFGAATFVQLEPWLEAGALKLLPFRSPWARLDYGFISLAGRTRAPAAEVFMEIVRDIERDQEMLNQRLADQWFGAMGLGAERPAPVSLGPAPPASSLLAEAPDAEALSGRHP